MTGMLIPATRAVRPVGRGAAMCAARRTFTLAGSSIDTLPLLSSIAGTKTSAFPGMFSSFSCEVEMPGAAKLIVVVPGGTSIRMNAPSSATPPETYGAESIQTFVDWKR